MDKSDANIFNIPIASYSKKEIFKKINNTLKGTKNKLFIATLNPEILLKAEKDDFYAKIIKEADITIIDGFGINLVSFLRGKKLGERMAGADLAEHTLKEAKELNLKAGFIIRKDGLSQEKDLRARIYDLGIRNFIIKKIEPREDLNFEISKFKDIDVLLVGLGAPYQEKFIWKIKSHLPNLKIAMGVGGTFDFWTGRKKRAPKFMRKIGMEWLWRFFMQPQRVGRIWKATVVFLWKNLFLKR